MFKTAAVSSKTNKPGRKTGLRWLVRKSWVCYLLVAPFMLMFFISTLLPVILSMLLSLTSFNGLEIPDFVGISNYLDLFLNDDIFIRSIGNTLVLATAIGPGGFLLSLIIAWFLNELGPKLRSLLVLAFYLPSISANVYVVWTTLFSSDESGWLNGYLINSGLIQDPVAWLYDPRYMMPIVIGVALWSSMGTSFLSFIAGLNGIDRSYYEAAAVDGLRNRWQELWFITLPSMKPQLIFGAVMSIQAAFVVGDITQALCGMPSTNYAVHTIMNHLKDYGVNRYELGTASAVATVLVIFMVSANKLFRKVISKVGT